MTLISSLILTSSSARFVAATSTMSCSIICFSASASTARHHSANSMKVLFCCLAVVSWGSKGSLVIVTVAVASL